MNDFKALIATVKLIKEIRPDIIHTHTPKAGLIGMIAAKYCKVEHRIHTVAGMPLEGLHGFKKFIVTRTEIFTYYCANHVWPNSKSLMDFIAKKKFTSVSKLDVIGHGSSNGIDTKEYSKASLDEGVLAEIKEQIKFDSSLIYITFVGRIVAQKGINELVDVFCKLEKEFPKIRLLLVGPFEDERDPINTKDKKISGF